MDGNKLGRGWRHRTGLEQEEGRAGREGQREQQGQHRRREAPVDAHRDEGIGAQGVSDEVDVTPVGLELRQSYGETKDLKNSHVTDRKN